MPGYVKRPAVVYGGDGRPIVTITPLLNGTFWVKGHMDEDCIDREALAQLHGHIGNLLRGAKA